MLERKGTDEARYDHCISVSLHFSSSLSLSFPLPPLHFTQHRMESELSERMKRIHDELKRELSDVPASPLKSRILSAVYRPALLQEEDARNQTVQNSTKRQSPSQSTPKRGSTTQRRRIEDTSEFYA